MSVMRHLSAHAFAALSLTLFGCSSSSSSGGSPADSAPDDTLDDAGPDTPPDWDRSVTPPADDVAATQRTACGYKAGALPAETQGSSQPNGKDIPIETVVVLMQENRSFDHYFWKIKTKGFTDVEVAPDDFTNPDTSGAAVSPFRDRQLCFIDTAHGWDSVHQEIDGGKMDGFFLANDHSDPAPPHGTADMVTGHRAMAYYEPDDLPFMYWAADQFAIGDHYHCSVPGPTWPNRMYLYAASSFGRTGNSPPDNPGMTLFEELSLRGTTWAIYGADQGSHGFAMFPGAFLKFAETNVFPIQQYFDDAKAGKLPQVVFIDATYLGNEQYLADDEHPPSMMQIGQAFDASIAKALIASPQWPHAAMFLTYDEHGGLWDHVVPPAACPPDQYEPENAQPGQHFDEYGVRVPFVVMSPYAKAHYVGHHLYDHTSIVRFIQARFVMPALTDRDANAEAPWDMFDFSHARTDAFAVPDVPIDQTAFAACKAIWTP